EARARHPLFKPSPKGVEVRTMVAGDVAAVASLHRRVFSDYFLAHLGDRFVRRYYREFVDRSGNFGFVATNADTLIGFVVGTVDSAALYRRFYRRNFWRLATIALRRFLADPFVRRNVVARMSHIGCALRSVFVPTAGETRVRPAAGRSSVPARLLSIGLAPECRGRGVADELVRHFCERLSQEGFDSVGLSVRVDNAGA